VQVQLALGLDILHGSMQVLLPLGHVTWFGQGNNSLWVAMVPDLPSRTLGQGSFDCGGSTFRGTQHHTQHPLCLLHACCALLMIMGWEPNLPQRGMRETCTVTAGCVTPVLPLSQHAGLSAGNLYCSCRLQGQSQRLRQALASIRRD